MPAEVLVIRHGEKTGGKADIHLNPRGQERALALPRLFPASFATPEALFATKPSINSNRPVETITPLAQALNLEINQAYADGEYVALAAELLSPSYAGKVALVCWHHVAIPALAEALGVSSPPICPDLQFDHVWRIRYESGNAILTDSPQHLLDGDS